MNFTFSDEQEELRKTIRRFCDDKSPSAEVRRLMETDSGYDEGVWKQLAGELGLQGLAIPEAYGGQGFTAIELGIVMEEFGRALFCAPFFSTVCLAANAIMNAGTDEQKLELLPGIAAGDRIAALALIGQGGAWNASGIAVEAKNGRLTGSASYVIDGMNAHTLVVAARAGDDVGLYVLDTDADGVSRTPLDVMDATRKQATITFENAAATRLGDAGWGAIEKTLQQASVMLAAESAGGAQAALDMAVEYAKERKQFGRPIGQFQAVKHLCADMLLLVESSKTASYYAMWASAEDNEELPIVSSLAKSYATESYFKVASDNIQVHGGIGFTWEHDAHLFYKRAKSSELLLGDPVYHRELIADRLGI